MTIYQPPQEWYYVWLREWSPIILGVGQVVVAIVLAWLTYKLWNSTSEYSKQVGMQTEIMNRNVKISNETLEHSKNQADLDAKKRKYDKLREEMDKLVAPLYSISQYAC